jgi:hypothetical protein
VAGESGKATNAEVATVLDSISASSDTEESEEQADVAVLEKVLKK